MTRIPRLSVLIATFNRAEMLARTLPSVIDQDLPPDEYEVIVIDDGSTDATSSYLNALKHPHLKIIRGPNVGQGAAYNRGLEIADGDYVLFLDDDIVCPPSLLSAHLKAHAGSLNTVVSGPLRLSAQSRDTVATDYIRAAESSFQSSCNGTGARRWPHDTKVDANSSLARAALNKFGGFAPEFSRARFDVEMGLRLARTGFQFIYCQAAAAEQIYTKSALSLLTVDAPAYGRAELDLCRKFPEFRHASTFATVTSGGFWRRLLKRFAIGFPFWPSSAIAKCIGWFESLSSNQRIRDWNLKMLQTANTLTQIRAGRKACGSKNKWKSEFALTVPVLLYHHVGPLRAGTFPTLTVSPENFKRHLGWLKNAGYNCISASQWSHWYWLGKPLPEKPVILTFDDGYKDLAEHAFHLLVSSGVSATVYIITSQIGGENLWDQQSGSAAHSLLSEDDIRTWSAKGIDFGSHSHTHADLTTLTSKDLHNELTESRGLLSKITGKEIASFAYPYGACDACVQTAVRELYRSAFTTVVGVNSLATDPAALKRTMVKPSDTRLDILARARLGWDPIEGARLRIARARGRI